MVSRNISLPDKFLFFSLNEVQYLSMLLRLFDSVVDGIIWEGISIPYVDYPWDIESSGSLNPYVNAYSMHMLRAPWNNNPSAYIGTLSRLRFKDLALSIGRRNTTYGSSGYSSFPTCSDLASCYNSASLSEV